jgi:hypothetical protein|tara:strand:+ start:155 stop:349 length:195 start_codon:yes stop_codon:yes gene_type:complete
MKFEVGDLVKMNPLCHPEQYGFGVVAEVISPLRVRVRWEKLNWKDNAFAWTQTNMLENLSNENR